VAAADGSDESDETLEVTPNHRLYVVGRGWVEAGSLAPERDHLIDARGQELTVRGAESLAAAQPVYNFEVAEYHTYFVGQHGVWVHNPKEPKPKKTKPNDPYPKQKPPPRPSWEDSTIKNAWEKAKPGKDPGSKKCPTCSTEFPSLYGKDPKTGKDKRLWDVDHVKATWAQRRQKMDELEAEHKKKFTNKQKKAEYQKAVRLQCQKCNRSHKFEPKPSEAASYLKGIAPP
jgi:hypothetical protein